MQKSKTKAQGFSDFEREAMKNRAKELAAESRAANKKAQGEAALKEAIAAMHKDDQAMATRIHEIVTETAPQLWPKTWYGMPAYAKDGKVLCFFQASKKFETRYSTFGFNDVANLDKDNMWPTSFAIKKLTGAEEKQISELVRKAVS